MSRIVYTRLDNLVRRPVRSCEVCGSTKRKYECSYCGIRS